MGGGGEAGNFTSPPPQNESLKSPPRLGLNNPNAFIECSNTMHDVYDNINGYNPIRKRKKLILFDDMIADIMSKKNSSYNQRIVY